MKLYQSLSKIAVFVFWVCPAIAVASTDDAVHFTANCAKLISEHWNSSSAEDKHVFEEEMARISDGLGRNRVEWSRAFLNVYSDSDRGHEGPRGISTILGEVGDDSRLRRVAVFDHPSAEKRFQYIVPNPVIGRIFQIALHPDGRAAVILVRPTNADSWFSKETTLIVSDKNPSLVPLQNENNFQILPNPQVTKISFSTDGQDFWMFEQSSGNLRRYSNIPLTESAGATVNSKKSDFEYNVPSPVPSVRSIVGLGNGSAALEFENYIRVVGEDIRLTVALDPLRRHLHARNLGGLVAGSLYYVHRLRGGALLSLTFERAGTFIFRRSRREKRWVVHSWFGRPDVGPTGAIGVRHIIESPVGRPVEDRIFARPSTPVRAGFPRIGAPRPIVGQAPLAGGWLDNETIWRVDVAGNFEALRQYDGQYKLLARFKIETWVPDSSAIFRKRDLVSEVIIEYDSGHVNRIDLDAFRQLLSAGEQDH